MSKLFRLNETIDTQTNRLILEFISVYSKNKSMALVPLHK